MSQLRQCSLAPRSGRGPAGHVPRIHAGMSRPSRPRSLRTGKRPRATIARDVESGSLAWLDLFEVSAVKGVKARAPRSLDHRAGHSAWSSNQSLPTSCASIERMVASGSEPTYQPRMSYTSFAGLLLRGPFVGLEFLGAASTVVAVPRIRARASAIFVMGGLQSLCGLHSGVGVRCR